MQMRHKTPQDKFEPWIGALRVDEMYIFGDVVDCQILQEGVESTLCWRGSHWEQEEKKSKNMDGETSWESKGRG